MYPPYTVRRIGTRVLDLLGGAGTLLLALHVSVQSDELERVFHAPLRWLFVPLFALCAMATALLLVLTVFRRSDISDDQKWFRAYEFLDSGRWRVLLIPGQLGWLLVPMHWLGSPWWCYPLMLALFALVHLPVRGLERTAVLTCSIGAALVLVLPPAGVLLSVVGYTVFELLLFGLASLCLGLERGLSGQTRKEAMQRRASHG